MAEVQEINFDLTLYPTLRRFSEGTELARCLIGPAGSAKTSFVFIEALRRAAMQEPNARGERHFKVLVIRNTYDQLIKTTLDTAKRMLGPIMEFKESPPPLGKARFMLQDKTTVHLTIEFTSIAGEDAHQKLLGYEPTMVFIDEVSEVSEDVVFAAIRRLGRYPSGDLGRCSWSGVVMATNGPLKNHWLYNWSLGRYSETAMRVIDEVEKAMGRPFFKLYQQPPGLLRQKNEKGETVGWIPNPDAENIQNLQNGYAYYYAMLMDANDQKISAYVEGMFADLVTGKLVFKEFNRDLHVVPRDSVAVAPGMPVLMSFDFGRTPVSLLAITTSGGRVIVIDEFMGEDTSIDAFYQDAIAPTMAQKYPSARISGAWGDPAGEVMTQAVETSAYEVLRSHGVPIRNPGGGNRLEPRLEAVQQALRRLDGKGRPALQITDNCTFLIAALSEGYIYEMVSGKDGVVKDTPTKTHIGWASDLADALQYLMLGYNALSGREDKRKSLPPRRSKSFF